MLSDPERKRAFWGATLRQPLSDDIREDYSSMGHIGRVLARLRDRTRQFKKDATQKHCEFIADLLLGECPSILEGARDKTLVDIGCERGDTTRFFGEILGFGTLVGIERRRIIKHSTNLSRRGALFLRADCTALPIDDATADAVFLIGVLEHLAEPEKSLLEVRRIVRPEGIAVLQVPNRFFPLEVHTFVPFGGYFPSICSFLSEKVLRTPFYTRPLSRKETLCYLSACFEVRSVKPVWYPKRLIPSWLRPFWAIMRALQFPRIFPFAYLFVCVPKKASPGRTSS